MNIEHHVTRRRCGVLNVLAYLLTYLPTCMSSFYCESDLTEQRVIKGSPYRARQQTEAKPLLEVTADRSGAGLYVSLPD